MKRTYPLEALHRIRSDREEAAVTRLALARSAREIAARALEARRREHAEYVTWCGRESERLMEDLAAREIRRSDLENVKAQISWNAEGEATHLEKIAGAVSALEEAERDLETAAEMHRAALVALEKIEAHRKDWQAKLLLAEEAAEDAELQEAAELSHARRTARIAA